MCGIGLAAGAAATKAGMGVGSAGGAAFRGRIDKRKSLAAAVLPSAALKDAPGAISAFKTTLGS